MLSGMPSSWRTRSICCHRIAERSAGRKIERQRDDRELTLMIDRERCASFFPARDRAQRDGTAARRRDVQLCQRLGRAAEFGLDLQHYAILIELREHGGDLTLAESVVERVVDHLRADAQARRSIAIEHQRGAQSAVLAVAGHIAQLRLRLQLLHHARRPFVQLHGARRFQGVLELRAAGAIFHVQVLHGLHVERDASDFGRAAAAGDE